MSDGVRLARPDDSAAIAAIYAPIVAGTWISFEEVAPDAAEIARRVGRLAGVLPFLVYERGNGVAGYAYASKHRERAAYRWSVDVSAYVHEDHRRDGIARALYTKLFEIVTQQGYYNAFAGITLPNDASVGFHRGLGFVEIGHYMNVGFKAGAWRDTLWLQRTLREADGVPAEPVLLRDLDTIPGARSVG